MTDATIKSTADDCTIRFYFSFRSPYSWLALHRLDAALGSTGLVVEYIPVFPPPNFTNDPAKVPAKLAYIRHDVERIARAYGLPVQPMSALDCDWVKPHAAFLHAQDAGAGVSFARELFAARFSRAQDLGQDTVIAQCARTAGLDPEATVLAQSDIKLQERVVLGMIRGVQEDSLFGVPLFVHRGERFWGNDRIEWLLRSIDAHRGLPVPALETALLAPIMHPRP